MRQCSTRPLGYSRELLVFGGATCRTGLRHVEPLRLATIPVGFIRPVFAVSRGRSRSRSRATSDRFASWCGSGFERAPASRRSGARTGGTFERLPSRRPARGMRGAPTSQTVLRQQAAARQSPNIAKHQNEEGVRDMGISRSQICRSAHGGDHHARSIDSMLRSVRHPDGSESALHESRQ